MARVGCLLLIVLISLNSQSLAATTTTSPSITSLANSRFSDGLPPIDQSQYLSTTTQDQQGQQYFVQQQRQAKASQGSGTLKPPVERATTAPNAWRGLQQPFTPASALAMGATTGSHFVASGAEIPLLPVNGPANTIQQNHKLQQQQPLQPQPKSLKFTLISGKYWKFNVKTNSLQTSHKERELRLHRNISVNNFIIDDDGWFQYNHQQQQLFAWPSLSTEPATYYFVLLPSGLDYEADGENVINSSDVVANIVVELLPPLFNGARGPGIDQYIDHKFTLDYLHRGQSYPLLLGQIVSVFEQLARGSTTQQTIGSTTASATTLQTTSSPTTTTNTILAALQQTRLLRPLSEYLLINSSATQDGEFFSLTWTTHPSLINNTIAPIDECRLFAINDTVSKLSSPSLLSPIVDERFLISYILEGPLINSGAIIPTERGNYALQLSLGGPCRRRNFIDELGLSNYSGSFIGLPIDSEISQKEKIGQPEIFPVSPSSFLVTRENQQPGTGTPSSTSTPETNVSTDWTLANSEEREPGEPNTAPIQRLNQFNDSNSESKIPAQPNSSDPASSISRSSITIEPPTIATQSAPIILTHYSTRSVANATTASVTLQPDRNDVVPTIGPANFTLESTQVAMGKDAPRVELTTQTPVVQPNFGAPEPNRQSKELHESSQQNHSHQSQAKLQPSAKSLADFFDPKPNVRSIETLGTTIGTEINGTQSPILNPTIPINFTMNSDLTAPSDSVSSSSIETTTTTTTTISTIGTTAISQEPSLNEDLIGILNEVTEYLVSVAVPISIIIGILLLVSILIAICNLCMKKKKSKQFEMGDRFKFRYGSERRQFLKNSSKPVILEADQKSLSMGGTPQHRPLKMSPAGQGVKPDYQKLTLLKTPAPGQNDPIMTTSFAASSRNAAEHDQRHLESTSRNLPSGAQQDSVRPR